MSDEHSGVELTPQETAFFESKGETPPTPPPAEAEPQQQPEQQHEQQPEGQAKPPGDEGKEQKFVPLPALHEERGKRKVAEGRLREMELENARFRERFDILARSTAATERPPPKPEEDLFGAISHQDRRVENIERSLMEQQQLRQQEQQRQQLVSTYQADAARYAREAHDFGEAYQFLLQSRDKELQAIGYADPIQRAQATQNDELAVVSIALQNGMSPAEAIYNLALARGYTKATAAAGNATAAEKLATVAAGQAANKTLSAAGGSAGADEMTAERLLKMPLDEFETWTQKNPKLARQLMGG